MTSDITTAILNNIHEIEMRENVKVLHAVESGSRAWGVESPDSDYDVRFIYTREKEDYLSLREKRDVIEWQLDEVLDINGWDLKKALIQFRRGNTTLFEWAGSPIVYKTTEEWQEVFESCKQYFSEKASISHYYGTAKNTFLQYLQEDEVKYKKYIYALRPLLACRYIENYHAIPPVMFDELIQQNLPEGLLKAIEEMLTAKASGGEKDKRPRIPLIQKFITEEIDRYGQISREMTDDRNPDWKVLDGIFMKFALKLS